MFCVYLFKPFFCLIRIFDGLFLLIFLVTQTDYFGEFYKTEIDKRTLDE